MTHSRLKLIIAIPLVVMATVLAFLTAFFPWPELFGGPLPARLQDGLTIFYSIIIEAFPFLVLGVAVSLAIRVFVTPERLYKYFPKSPWLGFPIMALLGMFFPVCECGNMPVARQLMRQGQHPSLVITFLLGAPILNPVVLFSTYVAFRYDLGLVFARFALGFIIAIAVGAYFYMRKSGDMMKPEVVEGDHCSVHHGNTSYFLTEFMDMLVALSVGALIAALVQVFVPRSFLLDLGSNPVTAIAIMMTLALIVSLCSTVDAFFALSFSATFSSSSLLAFLVFGPMIDFRALSLLSRSFTSKTIIVMTVLVAELVFLSSLILHHTGII